MDLYKNKNFLLIISGKLISLMGNSIHRIGLMWYILSKYGDDSGKMLALIMISSILPTALLGGILGSLADRYNKKKILVFSDLLSGLLVFLLVFLLSKGLISAYILIGVTTILSLSSSLVAISVNSMIPEILDSEALYKANSSSQLIDRLTILFGLSIGGILVSFLGIYKVFFLNGISFTLSAFTEIFITYTPKKLSNSQSDVKEASNIVDDLKYIVSYLQENKFLMKFILNFTLVNFFWDPILNIVFPFELTNKNFKLND